MTPRRELTWKTLRETRMKKNIKGAAEKAEKRRETRWRKEDECRRSKKCWRKTTWASREAKKKMQWEEKERKEKRCSVGERNESLVNEGEV